MKKDKKKAVDPRTRAWEAGMRALYAVPLFHTASSAAWERVPRLEQDQGYARVDTNGAVVCRRGADLDPDEWVWVVAHLLLHRGLGHLADERPRDAAARAADCVEVNRFLREAQVGREPIVLPGELPRTDPVLLAETWRIQGEVPEEFRHCGTAGYGPDVVVVPPPREQLPDWPGEFAAGIASAAYRAVTDAAGPRPEQRRRDTPWERARSWFVSSYPLLGGLAAHFTIVDDLALARSWDISVAAVNAAAGEIYVNPVAPYGEHVWRFVLAHEMLHATLRHGDRVGGRDPYLWNVACDYVVNGWLVEMRVGDVPEGVLFDQALAGQSAEGVYDLIADDLRRLRKLGTLRGRGLGDILGEPLPHPGTRAGVDLDEYYRRALSTGLAYHDASGRGFLPSGLVEEIRALDQPPPPWDVQLARWFEEFVRTPVPQRSYARPSRRQASTPAVPRPGRLLPEEAVSRCTFGVLIDTSGSMGRELLGKALGAIASYATARDVPRVRVVFCDAAAYDAGYLDVADIAGRVKVRGHGGTVLQPGIRLLEGVDDFPSDAPILIITDGWCDVLRVRREHAYLMPQGARLPFTPRGPVFAMAP